MYQTNNEYKEIVYADDTQHLLKIYIEGEEVDPSHILDFKVSHVLFSNNEFTFGSVTAKTIEFKIYKDSLPSTYNHIYAETGVGNQSVPIGYFTLEDIKKDDDYIVTIKAIDAMVKFEFNYDGSTLIRDSENKIKPVTMLEVLQDICSKAGVECGSTSFLNSDKKIAVYDNTISAREYLSYIAEQAGGFATIGRDGKLYIKKIGENVIDFNIVYFQNYTWGEPFKVSRIAYEDGVQDFKVGTTTNNTIWIRQENMYIVDLEQIQKIYNAYQNFACYSFEGSTIIDPAYDIGDILVIDGKKIIYQGDMEYVGKFKADIKSNIQPKTKEETMTTISTTAKIRRVQSSINQVKGEIETIIEEVDENTEKVNQTLQTVDETLETISVVTDNLDDIKTEAVNSAVAAVDNQLGVKLADYPTTAQVETKISTKAGEITTQLNAKIEADLNNYTNTSDLNNMLGDYSTTIQMQNYVNQTVGSFEQTISSEVSTQISGINISTENLVYNSVGMLGTDSWGVSTSNTLTTDYDAERPSVSKRAMILTTSSTSAIKAYTPRFEVNSEGTYSVSGWVYLNDKSKGITVSICSSTDKEASKPYEYVDNSSTQTTNLMSYTTAGEWFYFKEKVTVPQNAKSAFIQFSNSGSNKSGNSAVVYLSDLMVVKGGTSATWNVSSKDAQAQIETNKSSIIQLPNQIKLDVAQTLQSYPTKTDMTSTLADYAKKGDLKDWVTTTTYNSFINQLPNQIESSVTEKVTKTAGISTENLVYNSVGTLGISSFGQGGTGNLTTDYDASRPSVSKRALILTNTTAGSNKGVYSPRFEVNGGETYSVSFWVYLDSNMNYLNMWLCDVRSEAEDLYQYKSGNYTNRYVIASSYKTKGSWQYVTKTVTVASDVKSGFIWIQSNANTAGGMAYVSDLMVVKGEIPKTWTPSNKDIQEQVETNSTSIKQTAHSISLTAKDNSTSCGITISLKDADGNQIDNKTANITMTGLVKFSDLSNSGSTTINGSNITTGTIAADRIDASNLKIGSKTNGSEISASPISWLSGKVGSPSGRSSNPIAYFGMFKDTAMNIARNSVGMEIWDNGDVYIRNLYTESGANSVDYMGYIKTPLDSNNDHISPLNYIVGHTSGGTTGINVNNYAQSFDIYGTASDENLKENIVDAEVDSLDVINQIRLISFNWKDTGEYQALGFSAQQLQTVCKDFVSSVKQPEGAEYEEVLQVRDFNVMPYEIGAIQQLSKRLEKLEKMLEVV